ncbi:MAG: DUF1552 domain-containing protein [Polyangiaceae bacterium]|nr:DUF1552 domain-containing protein [Polyangiaceae bacterium]
MKHLPRRTLLRGMGLSGICIGLPILDAMLDDNGNLIGKARAATPQPLNFLTFFIPNGVHAPDFWPASEGDGYAMSRSLEPLAHLKSEFLLLQHLNKAEAFRNEQIDNDAHQRGHASFATGGGLAGASTVEFASADQVAAQALGGDTKFRSLPVALTGVRSPANQADHISWSDGKTFVPADNDPLVLFNRVFGASGAADTSRPLAKYKKSIFDYVASDVQDLRNRVGAYDQAKLDQYMTAVRGVEQQLEPTRLAVNCMAPEGINPQLGGPTPSFDNGKGGYSNERAQLLIWLQVTAVACGLTRFGSFMLAGRGSKRQFNWLGIPNADDGHHGISHDTSPEGLEYQTRIVVDEMKQFAYMLDLMQGIQQGDRSLLYNSIVFFANECNEGAAHDYSSTPTILAGRAGGQLKTGSHIIYENATPYSRVFVSILQMLGMNVTKFGVNGDQPLVRLLA